MVTHRAALDGRNRHEPAALTAELGAHTERATGFGPATSCLEGRRSTAELRPRGATSNALMTSPEVRGAADAHPTHLDDHENALQFLVRQGLQGGQQFAIHNAGRELVRYANDHDA